MALTRAPVAISVPSVTGRKRWMLKLVVRTKTSSTTELAAKNAASSMALKYTEPWTAPAAWKNFGSTSMRISAVPSPMVIPGLK